MRARKSATSCLGRIYACVGVWQLVPETQVTTMYGNYRGYYSKRPVANDPRLAILPKNLFKGATVLDIGCNEGWVTCEIGAPPSSLLGAC